MEPLEEQDKGAVPYHLGGDGVVSPLTVLDRLWETGARSRKSFGISAVTLDVCLYMYIYIYYIHM